MGNRGEDMQQRTTGIIRTRVAAIRTEPIWYTSTRITFDSDHLRGDFSLLKYPASLMTSSMLLKPLSSRSLSMISTGSSITCAPQANHTIFIKTNTIQIKAGRAKFKFSLEPLYFPLFKTPAVHFSIILSMVPQCCGEPSLCLRKYSHHKGTPPECQLPALHRTR